jgi:hypothetical protein
MPTTNKIDQILSKFAQELQAVIREQLSDDVTAAVQAALGASGTMRNARAKARPSNLGSTGKASSKTRSSGKRTSEEIAKQAEKILAVIKDNPEQRSEQIAQATKLTTGELVLPIKKLLADKKIKAKGKARGTMYTAVG